MRKVRVAPKATPKKPSEKPDLVYISLRLRGLGRLIEHAANATGPDANPIDGEAAFFISTELDAMAAALAR